MAVPTLVLTLMFPVKAPAGTVQVTEVEVDEVITAALLLNLTEAPVKFRPVIVTDDPTVPLLGEMEIMEGVTINGETFVVPHAVETAMAPLVALSGTIHDTAEVDTAVV